MVPAHCTAGKHRAAEQPSTHTHLPCSTHSVPCAVLAAPSRPRSPHHRRSGRWRHGRWALHPEGGDGDRPRGKSVDINRQARPGLGRQHPGRQAPSEGKQAPLIAKKRKIRTMLHCDGCAVRPSCAANTAAAMPPRYTRKYSRSAAQHRSQPRPALQPTSVEAHASRHRAGGNLGAQRFLHPAAPPAAVAGAAAPAAACKRRQWRWRTRGLGCTADRRLRCVAYRPERLGAPACGSLIVSVCTSSDVQRSVGPLKRVAAFRAQAVGKRL